MPAKPTSSKAHPLLAIAADLRHTGRERHRARLVAAIQVYARTMPTWHAEHTAELAGLHDDAPAEAHATPAMVAGHQAWRRLTQLPALLGPKDWQAAGFAVGASVDELQAIETGDPAGLRLLVARLVAWAQQEATSSKNDWSEPLDKAQIAKQINREVKTLREWVRDGKIELKPCGGKWRYRLPEE